MTIKIKAGSCFILILFCYLEMRTIVYIAILYMTFLENTNGFVCTNNGLFANPSDMHSYYHCALGDRKTQERKLLELQIVDTLLFSVKQSEY